MFKQLFHSDVYFPNGVNEVAKKFQEKFNEYELSLHLQEHLEAYDDRSHDYFYNALSTCLSTINSTPRDSFEIEMGKDFHVFGNSNWHLTKYCIRIPYSTNQDLAVSIRPIYKDGKFTGKSKIITAWLNSKTDNHSTLDYSKYCSKEEWDAIVSSKHKRG